MQRLATSAGPIAWRMEGREAAPVLVICHGGALDHTGFGPLAAALHPDYRVLLWDLPGHGESRPMPPGFSVGHCTRALAELLDALGLASITLLGFSFGGMVAQHFLRAHGSRVRAVILQACFAPFLVRPPLPPSLVPVAVWGTWGWRGWVAIQSEFARRCSAREDVRDRVRAAMASLGKPAFLAFARALLAGFDPDPSFRITIPCLLLRGAQDSNGRALVHSMDALARAAPGADYVVVPGAGHCWHMEAPEDFAAAVSSFLRLSG